MPHYKLTYFDTRGLAEMSRIICHLGKIPYEDVRIPREEWPEKKKTFPFEQLPVLEVDDVVIPQSIAIARFLAKKAGLAGKTDVEQAVVDSLADQFKDFFIETRDYFISSMGIYPTTEEKTLDLLKSFIPARNRFLGYITNYLKKSKTGYVAGGDLTFVDIILTENVLTWRRIHPDYTENFHEVTAHVKKVTSIPELQEYLEKRPIRPF